MRLPDHRNPIIATEKKKQTINYLFAIYVVTCVIVGSFFFVVGVNYAEGGKVEGKRNNYLSAHNYKLIEKKNFNKNVCNNRTVIAWDGTANTSKCKDNPFRFKEGTYFINDNNKIITKKMMQNIYPAKIGIDAGGFIILTVFATIVGFFFMFGGIDAWLNKKIKKEEDYAYQLKHNKVTPPPPRKVKPTKKKIFHRNKKPKQIDINF